MEPLVSIIFHTFSFCFANVRRVCDWVDSFGGSTNFLHIHVLGFVIRGVCQGAGGGIEGTALWAEINKNESFSTKTLKF